MKVIDIKLGRRSYRALIGVGGVREVAQFLKAQKKKRVFIVSDVRLNGARQALLHSLRSKNFEVHEIPVTAGESLKDIKNVYPIYEALLKAGADRRSVLIALGGGSVGDAAGFVAATYLRGIDWIGVPTTLLAQVDSSVGGKTGINHSAGKNLIGAFHQPSLVVCDLQFLKTLSMREVVSGLGEIVKYALTFDSKFFKTLETRLPLLKQIDMKALTEVVAKSLAWKAKCVSRDEHDRTGVREALNFGHTFGHALESATDYQVFQHGEAVIWGMRFAICLSIVRGHLDRRSGQKMDGLLKELPIPAIPNHLERDFILAFMKKDKKSDSGRIRFVLLDGLGHSISDSKVTTQDLHQAYSMLILGGPDEK